MIKRCHLFGGVQVTAAPEMKARSDEASHFIFECRIFSICVVPDKMQSAVCHFYNSMTLFFYIFDDNFSQYMEASGVGRH